MTEYHYECRYCGKCWGGIYREHDPKCSKCGSEGDYYVKTYKAEKGENPFGYGIEEETFGKKTRHPVHRPDRD
jgi:hypothetical protein